MILLPKCICNLKTVGFIVSTDLEPTVRGGKYVLRFIYFVDYIADFIGI